MGILRAALLFCGAFVFCAEARCQVLTGLDALEAGGFAELAGKKVGVICNHTAVDARGRGLPQLLAESGVAQLAAVFTPEHGFDGKADAGARVDDSRYRDVPVYSLYGKTLRPTPAMLKGLDALVFDIQDAGARFYTYTTTMAQAMEEAAKLGLPFYVLDRPNPVTGSIVEGALLDKGVSAFTAYLEVPARHGMTAGELALWHAARKKLAPPIVVKMRGWDRQLWYDQTGLAWLAPSPNLRTLRAAELYPGIACFEASNLSVGRGTDAPFEWVGAPWLDVKKFLDECARQGLPPGAELAALDKTPSTDLYAGKPCHGVSIKISDRERLRPLDLFAVMLSALARSQSRAFTPDCPGLERMTGLKDFCSRFDSGRDGAALRRAFAEGSGSFLKERKDFLLY